MRVALISDLHGNQVALDVVLAEVTRQGFDQIVCLGDTATLGPRPTEVLACLRSLGCPCLLGNHDAFMLDPGLVHTYTETPVVVQAIEWCRQRLSDAELDFIRTFQRTLALDLGGGTTLLLFHGTPRSHMENILATTPPNELDRMLGPRPATVMAGGHTHIPMLRQHRGTLVLNPGSVGLAFEEFVDGRAPKLLAEADWALVDAQGGRVSVTLHRLAVDRAALRDAAAATDNPMAQTLVDQYA